MWYYTNYQQKLAKYLKRVDKYMKKLHLDQTWIQLEKPLTTEEIDKILSDFQESYPDYYKSISLPKEEKRTLKLYVNGEVVREKDIPKR